MNNQMARKIQLFQQLNLKNKLSKQEEQRQNHGHRAFSWVWGRMGEAVRGLRSANR